MDLREITLNYIGPKEHHYVPTQATHDSYGYDIRYVRLIRRDEITARFTKFNIPAHTQKIVPTGLRLAKPLPSDLAMTIWPRSSLFKKYGCIITNSPGLVDSLYKDEIFVSLYNTGDTYTEIIEGERIAQLIFLPVAKPLVIVDNSGEQASVMTRGGHGSTG